MGAFFFVMARFPEAQKKAQRELDTVVGTERLPEFSDRPSLPYVNALVKELLRWHPAITVGLPHGVVADDEYDGYFIPGGATVFANIWFVPLVLLRASTLTSFIGLFCVTPRFTLNRTTSSRSLSWTLPGIWTSTAEILRMSRLALVDGRVT